VAPESCLDFLREVQQLQGRAGLVVVVGCGTSELSHAIHGHVFENVVSMDIDPEQIALMAARHAGVPGLEFVHADVSAQTRVADGEADIVLDKATLDCVLCSATVGDFVSSIWRMLRVGGRYVIISLHAESLLRKCFEGRKAWCIEKLDEVPRPTGPGSVRLVVLRKLTDDALEADDVVLADSFSLGPLVAGALRQAEMKEAFERGPLPLEEAYRAIFQDDERFEYAFEDFEGDLAAFWQGRGKAPTDKLALDEALAFLAEME